ncbi:hypothetical protein Psi02_42580 [Planotetraspora silvatica]|uniref:Uncharacterized protein n=1 Tax=Planotetraspora silvatica TaxID=234614 RepID=A0A8J3UT05_9ACTN|nr:hypothetical protein [Planotetraspora silvatica]GII47834.1 hypothetical protein Psi02_42580 [Planotetraspora silvatica]
MHSPRENAEGNWSFLRTSVQYLALSAGDQLEWVGSMSVGVDELALYFDDAYSTAWRSRDTGWISEHLDSTLTDIDQMLISLTEEGPSAWTEDALHSHLKWEEIRRLAHHARALMPAQPWEE